MIIKNNKIHKKFTIKEPLSCHCLLSDVWHSTVTVVSASTVSSSTQHLWQNIDYCNYVGAAWFVWRKWKRCMNGWNVHLSIRDFISDVVTKYRGISVSRYFWIRFSIPCNSIATSSYTMHCRSKRCRDDRRDSCNNSYDALNGWLAVQWRLSQ